MTTVDHIAAKIFDYIVIGGGTAGLALAARLSEDPSASVCVLEAGGANLNDAMILTPTMFGAHFGKKEYDWGHASIKQKQPADRVLPLSRGYGLGGSSGINFMIWTKPPAEDVNDWERLGNPGWNWKNFEKYAAKVERFVEPAPELRQKFNIPFNNGDIGTEGALPISYAKTFSEAETFLAETIQNAGIPAAPRPYGGNPNGWYWSVNSHDSATATRSYAATGYYLPNKDRENLTVLTDAPVTRVITSNDGHGELTATDVEFVHDGKTYVVHIGKEAIISAGALKSPQLLELSGIGRRDVLEKAGIEVKVELPGVGENLQEHMFGNVGWELKPEYDFLSYEKLKHTASLAEQTELYKQLAGVLTMGFSNFAFVPLSTLAPRAAAAVHEKATAHIATLRDLPPGRHEQYAIQLARLAPGRAEGPQCEIIGAPGVMGVEGTHADRTYVGYAYGTNHALSRGSVHIASGDPAAQPEIDPNYFDHEADLDVLVETGKFCRKLGSVAPLKDMIEKEISPGAAVETEEQFREFVKQTYSTTWHTCGTCSMLPRDKGGVVDPTLKVYGTTNLRVVDLSIVPLHFAAHPQATVYVIAEQAADIIKGKFTP
ncbi:hypothetical protein PHLGIDRAFT_240841 [Phlebiopsis gigantea 11061_1 CR5-6]|uniref:Glucose-methanol-choline oxidoreductase N-terminal domain-containing protein n=1 Tax=Phlebiopsis gigantea (strain 11061_1 CR5-6) TaxID=745531 RepID=A0A0C3SBX1_PHLG1|nr:hypothetical protein PHLGIDRAFT_240841 [Phlebiopsis gigantea 11061_1 CR5-6]